MFDKESVLLQEFLLAHEATIRISFFLTTLVLMATAELVHPKRALRQTKSKRWSANLGIVFTDSIVVKLAMPILPVTLALDLQNAHIGLFHLLDLPQWLAFILTIVLLDGIVYWQHVVFHRVPLLWRLHKVHHSDVDLDVTSGNRFHPIEILLSLGIKLFAVTLLGAPAVAVLCFEIVLNGMAQFNHSNVALGGRADALLRILVVTPDMHRVHHSILQQETGANFGFNLSIWDRLFGTYIAQPRAGHQDMLIGLPEYRSPAPLGLVDLLALPFRKPSN